MSQPIKKMPVIKTFGFQPGRIIAGKYEIISLLGRGWESEVYKTREINTGIERAAKIFFPHRNKRNRVSQIYANKLNKLRECPAVIHYHTQESITFQKQPVTVLISEYVKGEMLSAYIDRMPGKRLMPFQAIHLLYALTLAIENIHYRGEYHGDLHTDNVIVRRLGLSFDLKLLDFFHWGSASRQNRNDDILFLIRILYDAIGGKKHYARLPHEIKQICCGLKSSLILKKFKKASDLRIYLEALSWS